MIFYEQLYRNDQGQAIIQNHIVDGLPPSDFPEFLGIGFIAIQTPMGPMEERIEVPIQASDLRDAFTKFNDVMEKDGPVMAQKKVESIQKRMREQIEAQQKKIVTPGTAALPPFKGIVKE